MQRYIILKEFTGVFKEVGAPVTANSVNDALKKSIIRNKIKKGGNMIAVPMARVKRVGADVAERLVKTGKGTIK